MLSTVNSPNEFSSPRTPDPDPSLAPRTRFRNRRDELNARPKLNAWTSMPVYRRFLLVFLVLGVLAVTFREKLIDFYYGLQPATAKVLVVDFDGNPIPMSGRADIFQLDRSLFSPSPMPCLGSVALDEGMENLYTREGIATIAVADAWCRPSVLDDGDTFIHSGMAGAAQKRAREAATLGYRAVREPRSRSTSILHAIRGACTTRSSSALGRRLRTG